MAFGSKRAPDPHPVATSPVADSRRVAQPSILSADLTIKGDLKSTGDVQIDGTVEGDITSRSLTIGETARTKGTVTAETVRVSGTLEGEIKATSVSLARTAKVVGDIVHESLAIEAGATVEGNVRRINGKAPNFQTAALDGKKGAETANVRALN